MKKFAKILSIAALCAFTAFAVGCGGDKKAEKKAEAATVDANLSELLLEYNALEVDMKNQEKKIEKATKELIKTYKSVTEIAYMCGFNDLSYFIKIFTHI